MTCKRCGKEVNEGAFCPYCGTPLYVETPQKVDKPDAGYTVLGFFLPVIGLILYLVWKDDYPLRAKSCGKGALIGVIVAVALWVLSIVLTLLITMLGLLVTIPAFTLL